MPQIRKLTVLFIFTIFSAQAAASGGNNSDTMQLSEVSQGTLLLQTSESGHYTPVVGLDTEVSMYVTGAIARTVVTQTFANPSSDWVEALYAFPLPEDAAIDTLRIKVDGRIIDGIVQEKQQAQRTYNRAKKAGKKAALLQQHRPNLFTTAIANIPPNDSIEVELEFQEQVLWRDGAFSLSFPLAMTPRFSPARGSITEHLNIGPVWSVLPGELPNVVPLSPSAAPQRPVEITVHLNAGFPLKNLISKSHKIKIEQDDNTHTITLAEEHIAADRDFLLQWMPQPDSEPRAAFFTERNELGHFGMLMLMPPQNAFRPASKLDPEQKREVVFVLDTSGSMGGTSMAQAKAALTDALSRLKPHEHFSIVEFDNVARPLLAGMQPANASTIGRAKNILAGLTADGGTNISHAISMALTQMPERQNTIQQVVLITDGAVSNEYALMQQIRGQLGTRRLFTVGIGSAPNSYFMTEAAHFGRGSFSQISNIGNVQEQMALLFGKLENTVMHNLQVNIPEATNFHPQQIPDLYTGEPLMLMMQLTSAPSAALVEGRIGQNDWSMQLDVSSAQEKSGIATAWARGRIQHWMRQRVHGESQNVVREKVLDIALPHNLVSAYSSLVAVEQTPSRPTNEGIESSALKNRLPAGSNKAVVGAPIPQGATSATLSLLSGGLLCLIALFGLYRRKAV